MICVGATKNKAAFRDVPALSLTVTFVPNKVVGNGTVEAISTPVARLTPKPATMDSGAMSFPRKLAAETVVIGICAALIVKFSAVVTPPPGVGVKTVTCAVPALAIRLAVTCAVNCVAPTNVVDRSCPFHRTFELATKLVPVAVNTKAAAPAVAEFGLMPVSVGAGFCPEVMLKVPTFEVPPPGAGLKTVTLACPVPCKSDARICAVN